MKLYGYKWKFVKFYMNEMSDINVVYNL